jgi:hypothetical protein
LREQTLVRLLYNAKIMKLYKEKREEFIRRLSSGNEKEMLSALEDLRFTGDPSVLPAVISIITDRPDGEVRIKAIKLLNDLKDKNSIPYIIDSIKNLRGGRNGLRDIVSACWQNGLNFSEHLELFSDLVFEDDLETAMESFTVIEENIPFMHMDGKKKLAERLSERPLTSDEIKNRLIKDLKLILQESMNT